MNADTVIAWRLLSQQIDVSALATAQQVAHWLGGVQAQDEAGARWSIGLRLPGATDTSVEQAIAGATVVRTWAFRGTLHFLSAADVEWLTGLLAPTIIRGNARRYKQLELAEPDFSRSNDIIATALGRHGQMARSEIATSLEAEGISAAGQRLPYLLQRATLDGVICHGRPQGRESTYVLLNDWIQPGRTLSKEEGLAELATRYFTSHGPATVQDFAWWSGLPAAKARQAVAAVSASFVRLQAHGKELWAAEAFQPPPSLPSLLSACFLSPFDEYLLGYQDRRQVLDPAHVKKVNTGGGMPKPTFILNGRVGGVWRRTIKRGILHLTAEAFHRLGEQENAAIAEAAQRFGRFCQMPVRLDDVAQPAC